MLEIKQDPKEWYLKRSSTRWLYYNGVIYHLKAWAELMGIKHKTLDTRINRLRWSVSKALTTPARGKSDGNV